MSCKYFTDDQRATILGIILTNPKASVRDIEKLCALQGVKISRYSIPAFQRQAKEMLYATSLSTTNSHDVIAHPVVESALVEAAVRIQELNDIYYRLKADLDDGKLWTEKVLFSTNSKTGNDLTQTEMIFNDALIREMRNCLNDIAKEVGGRSTHAIIEHRNADIGTVDIHAMILNVQQAEERRNALPESEAPAPLLIEGTEVSADPLLNIEAETDYIDRKAEENNDAQ